MSLLAPDKTKILSIKSCDSQHIRKWHKPCFYSSEIALLKRSLYGTNNCHAKAITVGDEANPGCDTYFDTNLHTHESKRIAGVGACKMDDCQFNNDFECAADGVSVGMVDGKINCLTYKARS